MRQSAQGLEVVLPDQGPQVSFAGAQRTPLQHRFLLQRLSPPGVLQSQGGQQQVGQADEVEVMDPPLRNASLDSGLGPDAV